MAEAKRRGKKAGKRKQAAARKAAPVARFSGLAAAALIDDVQVYTQLKICLSRITGFPINQIHEDDSLANKFHFDGGGLRVLAQNLEACFANAGHPIPKRLDRNKMEAAKTVGAIAEIINNAFGIS
jgi:hypothetical protein